MVSTIATFDQVEADIAGILDDSIRRRARALASPATSTLLQTVDGRLEAVTNAENLLFGGDANWLDTPKRPRFSNG